MGNKKKAAIKVELVTTKNDGECNETVVYLSSSEGKRVGVVTLKTVGYNHAHYKFENAVKLMIK